MKKKSKYIQPIIVIIFISIILTIGKQAHSGYYSCNDLTGSSFDLNLFKPGSTINLFIDNKLAKKANKLCIKQLAKDKNNPQFNFQVAYTFSALKKYDLAKKYLDLAIEDEYPAALYYSWIVNDEEWIDYKNTFKENLEKAAKSNYFAKHRLAYEYSWDAWHEDDPILSKNLRTKAVKLFAEIDFFLPSKNLLLIEELKDEILNYSKVKKLANQIEKNNEIIINKYPRHGYDFARESTYDLSVELGNNGYSNIATKYILKGIEYSDYVYKISNYSQKDITYDRVYDYQLLAFSYYNTGNLIKAEKYSVRALNLIQSDRKLFNDDPGLYANSLNNFGLNYIEMGQLKLAMQIFRQSVDEYNKLKNDSLWSLMPLANIGIFTDDKEESQLVLKNLFDSLINKKVNLKLYARPITRHIENYIEQEDIIKAREIYNKMITSDSGVDRETDPFSRYDKYLIELVETVILTEEKSYQMALENLLKTNSSLEKEEYFDFSDYNSLKLILLKALINLESKIEDKNISKIIDKETDIFSDHILNYIENLEDFSDEKIKEITGFGSGLLLDLKRKIKNNSQVDEKEFKIIQLLSMTEVDFSSLSVEQRLNGKNKKELKQLQILNYELKILKEKFSTTDNKDIENTIKKIENEKEKILENIGIFNKINLNFYSLEDFKVNLKPDESFVVFLESYENNRLDENILIRVFFDNNSIKMVDLSDQYNEVKLNIKKTLDSVNLVSWPPQDFATIESNKLFKILFSGIPLEDIQQNDLLIKNNGIISTLPFNILVKNYDEDPQNYETVSWLVDNNNIINIASFKYFFTYKEKKSIAKTFLGIGNPDFKKKEKEIKLVNKDNNNALNKFVMSRSNKQANFILDQLPETEDEIRKISKFFSNKNYKLFLSKNASESKIKKTDLKNYSYIIFATHAIPESETGNSQISGLALSYPKIINDLDNGFLNSKEIMNINLNSELVLLSACETATDNQAAGRAFAGMVNSFFFAGSNSVIASHWKIESNSTVKITTNFFKNLIDDEINTAKSLRKSVLDFKKNNKEFNHPAFWGAFSVILNSRYN